MVSDEARPANLPGRVFDLSVSLCVVRLGLIHRPGDGTCSGGWTISTGCDGASLAGSYPTSAAASRKYSTRNTRTALVRPPGWPAASICCTRLLRLCCSRLPISASASHNSGSRRMLVRPRPAMTFLFTNRLRTPALTFLMTRICQRRWLGFPAPLAQARQTRWQPNPWLLRAAGCSAARERNSRGKGPYA
jgi:hypothetical protein